MLQLWPGNKTLTIVTAASYVIKGFQSQNKRACINGSHGDVWHRIYELWDALEVKPALAKVKKHVSVEVIAVMRARNKDSGR